MAVPLCLRPFVAPSEAAGSEEHSPQPTANHSKILSHYPLCSSYSRHAGILPCSPRKCPYVSNKIVHNLLVCMCCHQIQHLPQVLGHWAGSWSCPPSGNHKTICKLYANPGLYKKVEMLLPEGISWNVCLLGTRSFFIFTLVQRSRSVRIWWDTGHCTHLGIGWVGRCMWPQHTCQGGRVWDMALDGLLIPALEAWPGRLGSAPEWAL